MTRPILTLASVVCALTAAAHAEQLTVEDTLATRDRMTEGGFATRAEWGALTYYLQGVIEGSASYGHTLSENGRDRAFCPPANKSYSVDEIFRFLDKASEKDQARPVSLVIVEHYAELHPCSDG